MEGLMQVVNRLQSACAVLGDNAASDKSLPSLWSMLPTIVVIGGQSSGKSSVLESVVGRDFLPRGTGIVTRRPLILQLVQLEDKNAKEWGEFAHMPGEKLNDFAAIMQEIEDETKRHLAKTRKIVSPAPIQLTVYSPNVPNLTLVDMPGLTKIPIDGQPKSIVQDLEDMARTYVKGENSIILAVSPANADLATSDALRMSREVDPAGERTIGVLTKIDIMDPGTDAREILTNTAVRLRNGWVGVVNRGQADLNAKVPMEDARRKELGFFKGKTEYKDLSNVGTDFLGNKLSEHLLQAIRRQMPTIQNFISKNITDLTRELDSLGGSADFSRGGMIHLILTMCRHFETAFTKNVDGGKNGGERILTVFEQRLTDNISKLNFTKMLDPKNVRRVIDEADGYQPHLVAPEMGYRRLVQECLTLLKGPSDIAVDEVHMVLRQVVDNVAKSEELKALSRYGMLKREIVTTANQALESMKEETRRMVGTMVEMEASYLTAEYFRLIMQSGPEGGPILRTLSGKLVTEAVEDGTPEERHLKTIAAHVSGYVNMVCTQLKHTIPKAIVHCLVVQSKSKLLEHMTANIVGQDEQALRRVLMEDEGTMKRREALSQRLQLMRRAQTELGSVTF